MTLFDLLPSLRGACIPRLDPDLWPTDTHHLHGRVIVDGCALEDLADAHGTPIQLGRIVVTRVRSVLGGDVGVDAEFGDVAAAVVANRHPICAVRKFEVHGPGRRCISPLELPADVRAGDVVALMCAESPLQFPSER